MWRKKNNRLFKISLNPFQGGLPMAQTTLFRVSAPFLIMLFYFICFAEPDETMPASIPAAIIADWEKQDGSNYSSAISKIKSSLSSEYASKITGTSRDDYLEACHWRRVAN